MESKDSVESISAFTATATVACLTKKQARITLPVGSVTLFDISMIGSESTPRSARREDGLISL